MSNPEPSDPWYDLARAVDAFQSALLDAATLALTPLLDWLTRIAARITMIRKGR